MESFWKTVEDVDDGPYVRMLHYADYGLFCPSASSRRRLTSIKRAESVDARLRILVSLAAEELARPDECSRIVGRADRERAAERQTRREGGESGDSAKAARRRTRERRTHRSDRAAAGPPPRVLGNDLRLMMASSTDSAADACRATDRCRITEACRSPLWRRFLRRLQRRQCVAQGWNAAQSAFVGRG